MFIAGFGYDEVKTLAPKRPKGVRDEKKYAEFGPLFGPDDCVGVDGLPADADLVG